MEKRVLLVDADPAFAERAALAFADADVALEAVVGEAAALDRARAARPDLVVLAEPSGSDAFALCDRFRRADELRDLPVVILAADVASDAVETHRSSGTAADLYLPRPAEPDRLLAELGSRLGLEIDAIDDDAILAVVEPEVELDRLRAELAEGQRALEELEQTVVALQKELHEERGKVVGLGTKLADTEARAKSLSEILDDSLSEREESDRAWTARLAEAERTAAEAAAEVDRARLDAASAWGAAEAARREAEEARAEAEAARAEAEAAKIDAIVARGEAEAASGEVGQLRDELTAARAELEAARAEAARLARELVEAGSGPTRSGADAEGDEALRRELAEVRADRERMQDELAAELSNLAHDLAVKDRELEAARRRVERYELAARKLEEERDRLLASRGAGDAAGELARLREELEELREENAFLGTEVDRYAARVRELEAARGSV